VKVKKYERNYFLIILEKWLSAEYVTVQAWRDISCSKYCIVSSKWYINCMPSFQQFLHSA